MRANDPRPLKQRLIDHAAFPYIFPGAVWLLLGLPELIHPHAVYLTYPIRVFVTGIVAVFQFTRWPTLMPVRPWSSAAVGLFGAAAAVSLLPLVPLLVPVPTHAAFDPARVFGPGQIAGGLVAFRVLGEGLVRPALAALFVYGFVMRFFIRVRFETVPLGEFSVRSLLCAVLFLVAFDPGRWPGALEMGLLFTGWFLFTRNLGSALLATVVGHLAVAAHLIGVHRIELL